MKLSFKIPKLDVSKLLLSLKRNNFRPSARRANRFKSAPKNWKT